MNALATAPGVIATPGKYYIGAQEVMEYLDCKENKAYELIRQLRDELVKAGKLTPAYPIGKVPRKYFFERWQAVSCPRKQVPIVQEWNSAAVKFKNRVSVLWNAGVHENT